MRIATHFKTPSPRFKKAIVGTVLGLILVAAGVFAAGSYISEAQAAEASAIADASAASSELSDAVSQSNKLLKSVKASEVADVSTISHLRSSVSHAEDMLKAGSIHATDGSLPDIPKVESNTAYLDSLQSNFSQAESALRDAIADISASKSLKTKRDAWKRLKSCVKASKRNLGIEVSDETTAHRLNSAIEKAEALLDKKPSPSGPKASSYDKRRNAVLSANRSVLDSHAAYIAARSARPTAAASASRSAPVDSPFEDTTGVWSPTYTKAYGTRAAASDGSLTEWADGYYIAHDWSANGQAIASKPQTVQMNGKTYRYAGCTTAHTGDDADPYLAYARSDGGIGFQTCYGSDGTVIVTHYVPVR
mgnify:CR=1 FL=1